MDGRADFYTLQALGIFQDLGKSSAGHSCAHALKPLLPPPLHHGFRLRRAIDAPHSSGVFLEIRQCDVADIYASLLDVLLDEP